MLSRTTLIKLNGASLPLSQNYREKIIVIILKNF